MHMYIHHMVSMFGIPEVYSDYHNMKL